MKHDCVDCEDVVCTAIDSFAEPPTELSACMCECRNIVFKSMWVEGLAPQFLYIHYLGSECQLSSLVLLSKSTTAAMLYHFHFA